MPQALDSCEPCQGQSRARHLPAQTRGDAALLTSRITHIRCSSLQPTVRPTPACGLLPAADRVTHNHVTLHVDGINHFDSFRFRASSRNLHESRTTECKRVFAAVLNGMLSKLDEGQTVRGRA